MHTSGIGVEAGNNCLKTADVLAVAEYTAGSLVCAVIRVVGRGDEDRGERSSCVSTTICLGRASSAPALPKVKIYIKDKKKTGGGKKNINKYDQNP
jgi:hypothetical protein